EGAVASGIWDTRSVTSRSRRAVEDHSDRQPELLAALERKGDTEKLAMLQRIETMANICFVRQQEPKGLGHAVLMARSTIGDEPFGVMLGDDVFVNDADPCLGQLIRMQARLGGTVLAVMRVPREKIPSYGVVALDADGDVAARTHRVRALVEKPPLAEAPSDLAIMGRYVLSPSIFRALEVTPPGAGGEIQLTDGIRLLSRHEPVYAYEFEGTRYDTGDPVGLLTTSLAFTLARPDLAPAIKAFLKTLNLD